MSLASWFLGFTHGATAGLTPRSMSPPRPAARRRPFAPRLEALEDRAVPSVNLVESEANNTPATANAIGHMLHTEVNISGRIDTLGDRDWFRFEFGKGDVFGAALRGKNGMNPALRLVDSAGQLLVANDDALVGGKQYLPRESPLPHTTRSATDAEVYYVISTAGTYFLEVSASGDGSAGKYKLDTMVARPVLEREPVGTKQILFLDFDGGTARFDKNQWTVASVADSLPLIGLNAVDANAFVDSVVARVTDRLQTFVRANGLNGDYSATGIPGQFDIEIRNSRDHADEFGTNPFVSRILVGWTNNAQLANDFIGLAEGIDVGNFKTDDQAAVSLNFANFALGGYPVQAPATRLDMIAEYAAVITAHEFGHLVGCYHTDISLADPFAGTPALMDKSFDLLVGPDLTFGTVDDVTLQLGTDLYHVDTLITGLHDLLNTVAFGLSTGTRAPAGRPSNAAGHPTANPTPAAFLAIHAGKKAGTSIITENGVAAGQYVELGGARYHLLTGRNDRDIFISGPDSDQFVVEAPRQRYDANAFVGVGNDTTVKLNHLTVSDDAIQDVFTGTIGQDRLLVNLSRGGTYDKATDLSASEFADDLDFING
jgi:hypothetical protein